MPAGTALPVDSGHAAVPLEGPLPELDEPVVIAAFDGWVDAGSAATTVLDVLADDAPAGRRLRPRPAVRLPLAPPDARRSATAASSRSTGRSSRSSARPGSTVATCSSSRATSPTTAGTGFGDRHRGAARPPRRRASGSASGAIPAAVAHTRPVPILGTASRDGLLRGGRQPGTRRAPARARRRPCRCSRWRSPSRASRRSGTSPRSRTTSAGRTRSRPWSCCGPSSGTSTSTLPHGDLVEESRQLRIRLDAATAADETTRAYVERLESMVDESRQPAGDDLIADIERFLRDRSGDGRLSAAQ